MLGRQSKKGKQVLELNFVSKQEYTYCSMSQSKLMGSVRSFESTLEHCWRRKWRMNLVKDRVRVSIVLVGTDLESIRGLLDVKQDEQPD